MAIEEYVLRFAKEAPEDQEPLVQYVVQQLEAAGLVVQRTSPAEGKHIRACVVVSAPRALLEAEAEHLQLLKTVKSDALHGTWLEFEVADGSAFEGYEKEDFFSPCEESHLLYSALESVDCTPQFWQLMEKRTLTVTKTRQKRARRVHSLLCVLMTLDLVELVAPLHRESRLKGIRRSCFRSLLAPVDELQPYFGAHVTFYFAWISFVTQWLLAPACLGGLLYLHRAAYGYTVDNHPWLPVFGVFMVLWGILFLRFWSRRSAEWACRWRTMGRRRRDAQRPQFRGETQLSPITGQPEIYYPKWKRRLKYVGSALVTAGMLVIAFVAMICSLNLQGYIKDDYWAEAIFHIPMLAQLSQPGAAFDADTMWAYVPTLMHTIVIGQLNGWYRSVSESLTEWENHRTRQEHENAIIIKRFLFEAFDCYVALFYLAFFQLDVVRLREELVGLYTIDSLRRVVMETIVPGLGLWASRKSARKELDQLKVDIAEKPSLRDAVIQAAMPRYEAFDDYLEMVIEFGYITLFASAYPLAACISIAANVIEIKSDSLKLATVYRRPPSEPAGDIGTWEVVLKVMVGLSILTNCMIFAFTSQQMMTWIPQWFDLDEEGDQMLAVGMGRYVVGLCFGMEHLLVLAALTVWGLVPGTPDWVKTLVRRHQYHKDEIARQVRKERSERRWQRDS